MSMDDARLDHLTLRLDSLREMLLHRAEELADGREMTASLGRQFRVHGARPGDNSAHIFGPAIAEVLAAEFRAIAASLE